jgi:Mor family transcriptional regulator
LEIAVTLVVGHRVGQQQHTRNISQTYLFPREYITIRHSHFTDANMELPASVQEIADVIGRDKALLLIGKLPRAYSRDKRYPGARNSTLVLYVPTVKRLGLDHMLVKALGYIDAVKMCEAFGGEIMYPATCANIHRAFRDQSILSMVRAGMRPVNVAAIIGVSERHVRNLVKENPPEDRKVAANDNADVINGAVA